MKLLNNLLDSDRACHILSLNTAATGLGGKIPGLDTCILRDLHHYSNMKPPATKYRCLIAVASWPGLTLLVIKAVEDILANQRKQADCTLAKALRRVFHIAEQKGHATGEWSVSDCLNSIIRVCFLRATSVDGPVASSPRTLSCTDGPLC